MPKSMAAALEALRQGHLCVLLRPRGDGQMDITVTNARATDLPAGLWTAFADPRYARDFGLGLALDDVARLELHASRQA